MGIRRRQNLVASLRTPLRISSSGIVRLQDVRRLFLQRFSRGLLARRIRRPWPPSRKRLRDSIPVSSDSKGLRGGKFPIRLPALRIRELWPLSRGRGFEISSPERTVSHASVYQMCGFEASETIPFSGADSIFSSCCGAISGQARDGATNGANGALP